MCLEYYPECGNAGDAAERNEVARSPHEVRPNTK
jgi:hypothetical protein